jgi:hypothetical protein
MKTLKKKDYERIKKAFTTVYYEKEKTAVGDSWRIGVMGYIRDLGPIHEADFVEIFQRLIWRLAPITCGLVLLLGIAVTQLNVAPDYELMRLFIDEPADFNLSALYNQ